MSARRSVVTNDHDARLFEMLRGAAERHADNEKALAEYIREAWRCRWTYRLIGEAMGMSARRVSAIRMRDLKRRGLI